MNIQELKEQYIGTVNELNTIQETVKELDAALNAEIEAVRAAHLASHGEVYDLRNGFAEKLQEIEASLRNATVESYQQTGEKKVDENLSVRVTRKLNYDQSKAVAWAETNAPVMIVKSVDKKAFEAMPTVTDLDFVEVNETATAVISGLPRLA